jgi:effector-binding domain-containing protein
MKILRRILLSILVLIAILIGIGFFLPRHVHVIRSLVIKAPSEFIYEQVNSFKNWKNWSPWHQLDTNMKMEYAGPAEGIGASFTYQSDNKKVGNGRLTITNCVAYDSIVLEMDFMENGKANGKFVFTKSDSGTLVEWIMESDLGNKPISRWFGLFMDNMVGNDFEKGLASLNQFCIANQENAGPRVEEKQIPAQITLTIRDTCSQSTIGSKLGIFYGKISQLIKTKKLSISGAPFAIYHNFSRQSFDIEAGIPVNERIESSGEIICKEIPSQKTVMAIYKGPYENTGIVYASIERYIKDKNLTVTGPPWEVYITDPLLEPDTEKWQTDIYFPIK